MEDAFEERFTDKGLTTQDLEGFQADIEILLRDHNVYLASVEMLLLRPVDIYFRAPGTSIKDLTHVIIASGGSLVFMEQGRFDPDSLLLDVEESIPEDTAEITGILESAEVKRGELSSILLTWTAQGMVYRWQAVTEWAEAFQESFDEAITQAQDEESKSHEDRNEERGAAIQGLVAEVMGNPVYRETPPHRRGAVAKSLLTDPQSSDEYTTHAWGLQALARRDRAESERRNVEIVASLEEFASDLVASEQWRSAMTIATRKRVARDYLIEKSEGWCAPGHIVDELRERASQRFGRF